MDTYLFFFMLIITFLVFLALIAVIILYFLNKRLDKKQGTDK